MVNLPPIRQILAVENPLGRFVELKETSRGKDTMTGHGEMMGLNVKKPFRRFAETGFLSELIEELEKRHCKALCGKKGKSSNAPETVMTMP